MESSISQFCSQTWHLPFSKVCQAYGSMRSRASSLDAEQYDQPGNGHVQQDANRTNTHIAHHSTGYRDLSLSLFLYLLSISGYLWTLDTAAHLQILRQLGVGLSHCKNWRIQEWWGLSLIMVYQRHDWTLISQQLGLPFFTSSSPPLAARLLRLLSRSSAVQGPSSKQLQS